MTPRTSSARQRHADDLQPARQRGEGELVDLGGVVAEQLVVERVLDAGRHQHPGGDRDQLLELGLDAAPHRGVLGLLLEEPRAVGDVPVLVLGDLQEALEAAREDVLLLEVVLDEELPGQREGPLDDHVVQRHEVDLRLDVARVGEQAVLRLDEVAVEELDERVADVVARALRRSSKVPSIPRTWV